MHSKLTLPSNSFKYDNAMVTATVFAPQAIRSNNVLLRIQGKLFIYIPSSPPLTLFIGLLDVVHGLNYNSASQQLIWTPPFTLFGVPILYYKIVAFNITTNSTLPTLSLPCSYCMPTVPCNCYTSKCSRRGNCSINKLHIHWRLVETFKAFKVQF